MGAKKRKNEEAKIAKKERQNRKQNKKLNKETKMIEEICLQEVIITTKALGCKKLELVSCPSPRINASLINHPDKDGLYLYGGEFDNGKYVAIYEDFYYYSPKKDQWTQIFTINTPPPRSSHQLACLSQGGGQLWLFGGEYTSQSSSNYHHYNDLWIYHISKQEWEQIIKPGAPSPRSGHRMVVYKKLLVFYGGFFNNEKFSQYYNDLYLFHTEERMWMRVETYNQQIIGAKSLPAPRSAHHFLTFLPDNNISSKNQLAQDQLLSILLVGGYTSIKKEGEKFATGHSFTDIYKLCPEKSQSDMDMPTNWRWTYVKQSGNIPSVRCGTSMVSGFSASRALMFGGVFDAEQTEESICGSVFYNDMYQLDMSTGRWFPFPILKRHINDQLVNTTANGESLNKSQNGSITDQIGSHLKKFKFPDGAPHSKDNSDSDIQTKSTLLGDVKLDDNSSCETKSYSAGTPDGTVLNTTQGKSSQLLHIRPSPRMKPHIAISRKGKVLYLFGGLFEDVKDRIFTLNDFYRLDLKKAGGGAENRHWIQISPDSTKVEDYSWSESSSSSDSDGEDSNELSDSVTENENVSEDG